MTQKKKQLNDLFKSVENDTPSIERGELRSLLDEKTSGNIPTTDVQKAIITEDRRRGLYKKGIIIMTIIGVFTATILFLFSSHDENKLGSHTLAASSSEDTKKQNGTLVVGQEKENISAQISSANTKEPKFHVLKFERVDLSSVKPLTISTHEMKNMGIVQSDNGKVVYYHYSGDLKVEFPTDSIAKSRYNINKDERAKSFEDISFFPTYVTDSKGNLVMIYKHIRDSNSVYTMVGFPEQNAQAENLLKTLNYFRTEGMSSREINVDSSGTPWLITTHYHLRIGIMSMDTEITRKKDEDNQPQIHLIRERLAQEDSLFKMRYGGETGLKAKFQFTNDESMFTSIERKINDSLNKIMKAVEVREKLLNAQVEYLTSLLDGNYPDTLKLKIEQLSRKIGYEAYILTHQREEKELASITSLVPVKVRENTGMKKDGKYDNGLIFWYEPTPELFAALPQAKERLAVDNTLFHGSDEIKNVTIYPNPANLYLFVRYSVSQNTKVSISILNLLGKRIADNISSHNVLSGDHKESISLNNIPPGIYLVLIRTDHGEQSIYRLIIEK